MLHCRSQIVWIVVTVFVALAHSKREGDACFLKRTGMSGTCKLISNCPSVQQGIQSGIPPVNCGYAGKTAIVCCPQRRVPTRPPVRQISISESKCSEYLSEICRRNLIFNGMEATPGEFPYMVALGWTSGRDVSYGCGGTLISESFVLTAAHCVADRRLGSPDHVSLGAHNIDEADGTKVRIKRIISHPKYSRSKKINDIALIELQRATSFDKFIRPACLWRGQEINDNNLIATGWGLTENGRTSNPLLKLPLDIVPKTECEETFTTILPTQLCTKASDKGDTCQGDSGGPIAVPHPDNNCMRYVIGVTSYGMECGTGLPAVYTRVSEFIPWIESIVWPRN